MTNSNSISAKTSPRGNRRRGQAMVEFSLVFIIFLMLMVGLFELGRVVWIYTTVAHAARQGARYAMVHGNGGSPDDAALIASVKAQAVGLTDSVIQVTPTWEGGGIVGSFVSVRVSYAFVPAVGGSLVGGTQGFNIASTSRMVVYN
jgi:Flp pilus assembly protein TadG